MPKDKKIRPCVLKCKKCGSKNMRIDKSGWTCRECGAEHDPNCDYLRCFQINRMESKQI